LPAEVSDANESAHKNFDAFFLNHLQSVKSNSGNYYTNQRFVGKGGNGTTFLVTCTSGSNNGVQFAMKVFHKISNAKRRKRFLDEVRHYRNLNHPSIIDFHDEGTFKAGERQYPFAIVDYIPENLENILGRGLPHISRLEAIRYILNVASGVAFLHSREEPIVHRDIKPANILVFGQSARLGDLGLAKVLMNSDEIENTDEVAAYVAMPYFHRTPELVAIARNEGSKLTPASDIYQLGLVLYRALTGFNPQKQPINAATDEIQLDIRTIPGACGHSLNSLVNSMLMTDPARRPSAPQVLQQLGLIHKEICTAHLETTGMML
jgi:serine/threonine-protein kinase